MHTQVCVDHSRPLRTSSHPYRSNDGYLVARAPKMPLLFDEAASMPQLELVSLIQFSSQSLQKTTTKTDMSL